MNLGERHIVIPKQELEDLHRFCLYFTIGSYVFGVITGVVLMFFLFR